jgi:signal transduction histidine kinase
MTQPLAVLIVEDSQDDVEQLLRVLRHGGYTVDLRVVVDLEGLRDALSDPRWDLVLSDWTLPGFTGLDAFQRMRERGLDLPFIIVSDSTSEEIVIEALRAGVHDVLSKDRLIRLLPAVARELAEARSRRQRRLTEAELHHRRRQTEDSERLLRLVIESVPDAVAVVDQRGEFLLWNQPAEPIVRTLWGDPGEPGATGGRPGFFAVDRHTPFEDLDALLQRVATGESVDRVEIFLRHPAFPDGRFYSIGARPLRDAGGVPLGAVAVFHDSSSERAAQEQVMISDRLASLGMLAAGVAHEINNPLAAVLANLSLAQTALASAGRDQQSLTTLLDDAAHAAQRVRDIVRDLRVFARHDERASEAVDVNQVMDSSIRMAFHQIRERAQLSTDYAPEAVVAGNESRLGQVFLNLLVNAAQAISDGDPAQNSIRVRTRIAAPGRIAVEVSDSGSGMSPEVRDQLFKPFFTTKSAGLGTGLGLAICQRIVHELDGRIEVESAPGRGSTFRVLLPQASSALLEARHEDDASAPRIDPRVSDARAKVLVIDDEPLIGAAVIAMLGGQHDVVAIEHAEDALSLLDAGEAFDVIFCDLLMPGMGGRQLYERLQREHPRHAADLLFLTGGAVTEDTRAFLQSVPDRVVDKPFDAADLQHAVERRLRRRGADVTGGGA